MIFGIVVLHLYYAWETRRHAGKTHSSKIISEQFVTRMHVWSIALYSIITMTMTRQKPKPGCPDEIALFYYEAVEAWFPPDCLIDLRQLGVIKNCQWQGATPAASSSRNSLFICRPSENSHHLWHSRKRAQWTLYRGPDDQRVRLWWLFLWCVRMHVVVNTVT